jgi:murein DD-endopeptidase MepM/ murein hydrolase activator NlpD
VASAAADTVLLTIPRRARSGTLRVIAGGRWSKASTQRLVVGTVAAASRATLQARADTRKVFLDGVTRPSVSYYVGGRGAMQVQVDLVRQDAVAGPVPVATWTPAPVAPGSVETVTWDGALGPVAPVQGRYVFRITPAAGGLRPAAASFEIVGNAFPVQGPHTIGMDASQRFGAARDGHVHEGQDVFADCGTPLVAVTAGVIRRTAFQSAAGNYVVLRADGDGTDYAYMHLRDQALVATGSHVTTGQLLGYVGDTGDADGCHLHFEKWPAPGWYTGGSPVDPLPDLQAWDVA